MKISAVVQARMNSSRFPGKIAKEINGVSLLEMNLKRILKSEEIGELLLVTTTNSDDEFTEKTGEKLKIKTFKGSEDDVLDRFYQAILINIEKTPDYVVRLTADCPLIDPKLIDEIVNFTIEKRLDYCSNTLDPKFPDGQDVEVFKFGCLEDAWNNAKLNSEREHVTPYIWKNSSFNNGKLYKSDNFDSKYGDYSNLRMTVDEEADFIVIQKLILKIGMDKNWIDYATILNTDSEISTINNSISRNEGFIKSILKENEA
jgi:spore coat polysaccharide biosynthesis protein SpsF